MAAGLSGDKTISTAAPWLRICVTGGIGSGKSMAGGFLEELGVAVIEADTVCHDLMRDDAALVAQIKTAFGREITSPAGGIDRVKLGRLVFADTPARERLNAIVHPAAKESIEAWLRARREEAVLGRCAVWRGGAAAIIPLVYEAGWDKAWDCVICVGAPSALQRERLRSRGHTEKEANDRIAAQWPIEEKMKRADYVIFNSGMPICARRQAVQVMQQIREYVENSDGR